MDSIIEVQRQTHEEIEHFERAVYTLLSKPQPTHETRLQTEHKASQILDRVASRVVALQTAYDDQEARKAEIDSLSSRPDDLSEFYSRLGKIQEHYAKYPESGPSGFELDLAAFLDDVVEEGAEEEYEEDDRESRSLFPKTWSSMIHHVAIALLFSGEEQYGKYLDLYANHTAYNNLKHIGRRLGYLQYLDTLLAAQNSQVHSELPKECKLGRDYEL